MANKYLLAGTAPMSELIDAKGVPDLESKLAKACRSDNLKFNFKGGQNFEFKIYLGGRIKFRI